MSERLAFLGMGQMGAPMARNLLKAGYPVTVWNRTRDKAEALRNDGALVAETPAAATERAEVVLACLFDGAAVEAVLEGPQGVLAALRPGQVFVDHTTNSPPLSRRLAARVAERGATMLDAPVSGGDVGAQRGMLSIMCGGNPAAFDRCEPILAAMGRRVTLMGEAVGAGGYAKLANQILVAVHLVAMGEALVFGAKAGLDLDRLVAALGGGMANSVVLEMKADKLLCGDFTPGAELNVHVKDLAYIREALDGLGLHLPLAELVRERFGEAAAAGLGREDHSAVVRLLERAAGIEARRR